MVVVNVLEPLGRSLGPHDVGSGQYKRGLAKIGKLLRHKALYRIDHSRVAYGRAWADRYVHAPHVYHRIAYWCAVVEVYIAYIAEFLARFVSGGQQLAVFKSGHCDHRHTARLSSEGDL